jgi:hypothetical protein
MKRPALLAFPLAILLPVLAGPSPDSPASRA